MSSIIKFARFWQHWIFTENTAQLSGDKVLGTSQYLLSILICTCHSVRIDVFFYSTDTQWDIYVQLMQKETSLWSLEQSQSISQDSCAARLTKQHNAIFTQVELMNGL